MTNTIVNNSNTTAVQVALRIRPLTPQDKSLPRFSQSTDSDILKAYENSVIVAPHQKSFQFDHVFDSSSTQEQVFSTVASNFVDRFVDGYNVTILAYGQTSSGKTYTMGTAIDNQSGANSEQEGIIPRAMLALFDKIQGFQGNTPQRTAFQKRPAGQQYGLRSPTKSFSSNLKSRPASIITPPRCGSNLTPPVSTDEKSTRYTVLVSFIEIYNEELIDLLNPAPPCERAPVTIREDTKGHIIWTGLKEVAVSNAEDVLKYLQMGTENRATGSTDMNAKSSRSHAIFSVTLKQEKWWMIVHSKFHFVDLAGSERLKRTAAEGDRRKEGININAGLLALGNVISALSDPSKKPTHIPYRDSKLTRLLQDSLGGNSTTLMIACVSSAEINLTETVNTIKYAYRARNIRNKAERNE
ncbi:P-loop containing nucleoside triphosphate hydrolase protein, partial [Sporodiniella umbellata]